MCNNCNLCNLIIPAELARIRSQQAKAAQFEQLVAKVANKIEEESEKGGRKTALFFEEIPAHAQPDITQLQNLLSMLRGKGYSCNLIHGQYKRLEIDW